ncbi:MAG TPA: hypothetical protein VH813_01860 [Candidatus Limnocylindrales bacterium]|jgi:hypothetical protein
MVRAVVALFLAGGVVSACAVGISRERAIELATTNAGAGETVLWAESGPIGRFADPWTLPEEPRDRFVWAVLYEGQVAVSCVLDARGRSVCPPQATRRLVVLDFRTGAFIYAETT